MPVNLMPPAPADNRLRELDALISAAKSERATILLQSPDVPIVARRLMCRAARVAGVLPGTLCQRYCSPRVAKVRNAVILELRFDRQWTLAEIGRAFGLDRTTIEHICRRPRAIDHAAEVA